MFEESLKAYNVHSSIVITLEGACTKYEEKLGHLFKKGYKNQESIQNKYHT